MRGHVRWTPEMDERLRKLRSGGMTWDGIAAAMELGRNTPGRCRPRRRAWPRRRGIGLRDRRDIR